MQPEAAHPRSRLRWPLMIMATALVLLVFVGGPAVGILAAIAFPPGPPMPPDSAEVAHESLDYGVDTWMLLSHQSACAIAQFYQEQGGTCEYPEPDECPAEAIGQVAHCSGVSPYSIFALRWEVTITTNDLANHTAQLQLKREMLWSGMPLSPQPES
jgi:hypothetical protein